MLSLMLYKIELFFNGERDPSEGMSLIDISLQFFHALYRAVSLPFALNH